MYELVLVENGIYEGKKAGKVIIIFLENPFLIIFFNENSRPRGIEQSCSSVLLILICLRVDAGKTVPADSIYITAVEQCFSDSVLALSGALTARQGGGWQGRPVYGQAYGP